MAQTTATTIAAIVPEGRLSQETDWKQVSDDQDTPALFNATVLPASGAWRRSEIFDVRGFRWLGLWVFRTIDATSGTGSFPQIVVEGSAAATMPLQVTTASWCALPALTGIMTAVVPTGTINTGSRSNAPDWSYDTGRRFILKLEASDNDADVPNEGPYVFNVQMCKWVRIRAKEAGDESNAEKLDLYVNAAS